MEQKFVKDDKLSIADLLASKIQEIGENMVIRRFVRLSLGA
jgi:elongation factor Ts